MNHSRFHVITWGCFVSLHFGQAILDDKGALVIDFKIYCRPMVGQLGHKLFLGDVVGNVMCQTL